MFNFLKAIKDRFSKPSLSSLGLEGESRPLSREQMNRFMDAIKDSYKLHEGEKRRSLAISAGLFEKLAALDAATIAVAASITLAILLKPEIKPDSVRPILHQILLVVFCLWWSLVLSILHNCLAAMVAYFETYYSETDFVWSLFKESIPLVRETQPEVEESTLTQVEDLMIEQMAPKKQRIVAVIQFLYPTVKIVGFLAVLAFVVAYTMVLIDLLRLW